MPFSGTPQNITLSEKLGNHLHYDTTSTPRKPCKLTPATALKEQKILNFEKKLPRMHAYVKKKM
jgi:hypothetical protein